VGSVFFDILPFLKCELRCSTGNISPMHDFTSEFAHWLLELGLPLSKRPASDDNMGFTRHRSAIRENGVDADFWCGAIGQVRVEILDYWGFDTATLRGSQICEREKCSK